MRNRATRDEQDQTRNKQSTNTAQTAGKPGIEGAKKQSAETLDLDLILSPACHHP
jgi:hypothetical protein